jgi:hypothetical protein
VPKATVEPAPGQPAALIASMPIPAGAPAPLNLTARFTLDNYQVSIRGGAALARLRELANVAGFADTSVLDQLDGPAVVLDLTAGGPWLHSSAPPVADQGPGSTANLVPAPVLVGSASDHISGSLTLHGVTWKPNFLAGPVELSNAVLHFDQSAGHWDPVAFVYGPVRGTATLYFPAACVAGDACGPQFTVDFGTLDAAALQSAILGAQKPGTLLSGLLARLRPGSTPEWPELEGNVRATTLVLGPVTLSDARASIRVQANGTEIRSFEAGVFGGRIHAQGNVLPGEKPDYKLKGQFDGLNAADLGGLLGMTWSGSPIGGTAEVDLAGFSDRDLAASAKGALHFDWPHGSVTENGDVETPPMLARFDRWTADAEIADGAITLKQNQVQRGARKLALEGAVTFGDPPQVTFGPQQDARAANGRSKP